VGTGALNWVTVTCVPATRMSARRCEPAFGAALMRIDALPDPDAGFTVAHAASEAAVQPQALFVCTATVASPPPAGTEPAGAATLNWHGAASCDTSAC
jgi:hypothetical protein